MSGVTIWVVCGGFDKWSAKCVRATEEAPNLKSINSPKHHPKTKYRYYSSTLGPVTHEISPPKKNKDDDDTAGAYREAEVRCC